MASLGLNVLRYFIQLNKVGIIFIKNLVQGGDDLVLKASNL